MRQPRQSLQEAFFPNLVWGTNGSQDATHDSPYHLFECSASTLTVLRNTFAALIAPSRASCL